VNDMGKKKNKIINNKWSKVGCHTGNILVFKTDEGIEVYGGGTSRQGGYDLMSPPPELAIGPRQVIGSSSSTSVPDGFTCGDYIAKSVQKIAIDFPDFDIPQDIDREFWLALVHDIKTKGIKRISTQCVGGHGRTGVQLAILYHMLVGGDYADANALIEHVRGLYCHHAVETKSQQQYVADVCQIPMGESLFEAASKSAWGQPTRSYWEDFTYGSLDLPIDDEDDVVTEEIFVTDTDIPKDFDLLACTECGHFEWYGPNDIYPASCPKCGGDEYLDVTDTIEDPTDTCFGSDMDFSFFAMSKDKMGLSKYALALDVGRNTRNLSEIQCKKCKKYYDGAFIDESTWTCIECIKNTKKKKKGKKKSKNQMTLKQFGKNKNKKWSDKR
tara:strand:+ start:760 stop:1914 length:1155 start_codon:yes stop_codon:yes gene_type:complete